MIQSQLLAKTLKDTPREAETVNHKLLLRAGYIDQLMSGVYTYLPLGHRVMQNIANIIREELDAIGSQEMLMPAMQPKNIWQETGRWDSLHEIMYQFKDRSDKDVGLAATHEEVIYDVIRRTIKSYKDLPCSIYQIQNKFRNELRAKGGLMRGREFCMKDMYSFHLSQKEMDNYYYNIVIPAYFKIFKRCGLEAKLIEASGGMFTKNYSHEFQVISNTGEDKIIYCSSCNYGQNSEITKLNAEDACPKCGKSLAEGKSIEAGNIFQFGDKYAIDMKGSVNDENGEKKPILMSSYGIGVSRLVATIAEIYHDEKGLKWPINIAPFKVHLIYLGKNKADQIDTCFDEANKLYKKLLSDKITTLFDDRKNLSAGDKFSDSDLIGIPIRIVISQKTLENNECEIKLRDNQEIERVRLNKVSEYIQKLIEK